MTPSQFHYLDTGDLCAFDAQAAALQDTRPHPTEAALEQLGAAILTETLDLLMASALEDYLTPIVEGMLGGLHAGAQRLQREADRARDDLARQLRDFEGSEVADVELQDTKRRADATDVAVLAVERIRDAAAETYTAATGEIWSPWRGSVRGRPTTAAQLEARDAIKAAKNRRQADHDPGVHVVAFRASPKADSPEDASRIFDALNWAKGVWPDMSLALTGAPGGERLAKSWAVQKGVTLILAKPDFDRHGRAAPFRANDELLSLEPVCVLTLAVSLACTEAGEKSVFGPALNLAQKAAGQGVRCLRITAKPPT